MGDTPHSYQQRRPLLRKRTDAISCAASRLTRSRSILTGCFCLLMILPACGQRSEDWLPVTAQDLNFREVPGDPGAPAVQLYYADFRDDLRQSEFIYRRIKVLNAQGKRYANVEIEIPSHYSITDLQARTIHPDKHVIHFGGRPFEKTVVKYLGEKLVAKIFTLPDVSTGSIVEYKYRLLWNQYFYDPSWTVQHELYTVKESFWLHRYTGPMPTAHISDQTQLSYVSSNMPPDAAIKDTGPAVELQLENVPAFKPEPYMPPEANFRAEVQFFYGGHEIESPEVFWRDVGRDWYGKAEHFIGNHEELKAAAAEIIAGETDPEKQLRKLYARAQQTRNLSYQGQPDEKEKSPSPLRPNENVKDVFTRGYGLQNEIAELFAALARAAGFRAEMLRASDRRESVFDPKLLSEKQLETEIVRVKLNGSDIFLDPGTRFCPFDLVAWTSTSAPALELDKNGGSFVVIPTATADKTVTRRSAELDLNRDGSLKGEVILEFKGNQALDHRLDALNTDEAGRKRNLEDELRSWLPSGALVRLEEVQGWESTEEPLVARFSVQLPGFVPVAEKRFLVPANLFRSLETKIFTSAERKHPVYFPFTYEVVDRVNVHVPTGYRAETIPNGQDVKSNSTRFITTRSLQEGQLVLTRALVINSIYFQLEQYGPFRSFFDQLRAADEEQVVLTAP